jgi:hypothetical protein
MAASAGRGGGLADEVNVDKGVSSAAVTLRRLARHRCGRRTVGTTLALLLTTIDGIGLLTAAHIVAEVGDPAASRCAAALAAHVGVTPGTKQSGRWQPQEARLSMIGNARLRRALWMPTLAAVRCNPWLASHYQRLREKGKPPKVALIAAIASCSLPSTAWRRTGNRSRITQSRSADGISTGDHGPGSGAAARSPRPPPRGCGRCSRTP